MVFPRPLSIREEFIKVLNPTMVQGINGKVLGIFNTDFGVRNWCIFFRITKLSGQDKTQIHSGDAEN